MHVVVYTCVVCCWNYYPAVVHTKCSDRAAATQFGTACSSSFTVLCWSFIFSMTWLIGSSVSYSRCTLYEYMSRLKVAYFQPASQALPQYRTTGTRIKQSTELEINWFLYEAYENRNINSHPKSYDVFVMYWDAGRNENELTLSSTLTRLDLLLRQTWSDERLLPDNYMPDGVDLMALSPRVLDLVWKPDPMILNAKTTGPFPDEFVILISCCIHQSRVLKKPNIFAFTLRKQFWLNWAGESSATWSCTGMDRWRTPSNCQRLLAVKWTFRISRTTSSIVQW